MPSEIRLALCESADLFTREGESVLSMLREIKSNLAKIRSFLPEGEALLSRAESSIIELDDLASEIDRLSSKIESDPERLAFVNERLDTIYSLMQKHRVSDVEELITKREEIRNLVRFDNNL